MAKRPNKRKRVKESASGDDTSGEHVASEEKHVPRPSDETPTHREDFMRLLSAAAQKREQED